MLSTLAKVDRIETQGLVDKAESEKAMLECFSIRSGANSEVAEPASVHTPKSPPPDDVENQFLPRL
jgi:hypothetical protein